MQKLIVVLFALCAFTACKLSNNNATGEPNTELAALFDQYYAERMELFPLESTQAGDSLYNDRLNADFTDSHRQALKTFFKKYQTYLSKFDAEALNENDKISYNIFKYEMESSIKGLSFNDNLIPANQLESLPLTLGQLGSGDGSQPFKTVKDYDNWLSRAGKFSAWADSAIIYYKKGMAENVTLPASLVVKMIPQFQAMQTATAQENLFYGPIKKMPATFSTADKDRLSTAFEQLITQQLMPSYKKLGDFLQQEYLPKARTTTGINAIKGGDALYKHLVKFWTTTDKTLEEIFQTGLAEVTRITAEMEKIKTQVGFNGDLKAFFEFMRNDKQFTPYKTADEVLVAFRSIQTKIDPNLSKMFGRTPKTKFEIRQTEAFRAASASAEYNQGTADGARPGIFYVPIVDATKFNTTSGMESLFLHEAIPGHHYQISLQQENEQLPKFRRYSWYGAYGEGWALYCESLGKELGLYTDPYQYMGALGDEMHRAIRLVVDVAMHTGKMTREQAIQYMMDNEAISLDGATAEIERYMAIPGQALSYKIGALKISALREKYTQQLGSKFKLPTFHDFVLKDGCMPLAVLETKLAEWAKKQP
jgi:uncharacterized protein (DUF885 family)